MQILFNIVPIDENSQSSFSDTQFFGTLFFITLVFGSIHIWSYHLHRFFKNHDLLITSFSAGLAITYVFLHLLPDLEQSGTVFGKPIYVITLLGFIIFYGINSFIFQNSIDKKTIKYRIFYTEIMFLSIYNALIIFTLPEHLNTVHSETMLYLLAMGSHLLLSNYELQEKHKHRLYKIGCYTLACSLFIGFLMDVLIEPLLNSLISDILTAISAGFILFNVFVEELPHPKSSTFFWFLVGIVFYVTLLEGQAT